jgi:peptide/nickel transport system permease protein
MSDLLKRFFDSDLWYKFRRDPIVLIATAVGLILILSSAFAPLVAPHSPFDLKTLNLSDAFTPPAWIHAGKSQFMLGTDDQGRDVLSTIMYGSRASLVVGFAAVLLSMVVGIALGLISGYFGGALDAFIMRVADVQLAASPRS